MVYSLTVSQVPGFADKYRLERHDGKAYTVRGADALGKRLLIEAVTLAAEGKSPVLIRDENGRAMTYKPDVQAFVYN